MEQIFQKLPFIKAVVLGGSRATGTASGQSDVDIGIYYDREGLDYNLLNTAAKELDDEHRNNLICQEGQWGNWVNFGGWLTVGGTPTDLIFRDWSRVKEIVRSTDQGLFSCHYQTGHPHAFLDVMYRGELACCQVLYARDGEFTALKQQAEIYPLALKKSLADFFLFESGFSCQLAKKSLDTGDISYVAGHIFRSVSALNQVLFALNEQWLLNEKKAVPRIRAFPLHPSRYQEKIQEIWKDLGCKPSSSTACLSALCLEVQNLASKAFEAK